MFFEDAIKLMKDRNIPYIKIIDAGGKRIAELTEFENVQATIDWLEENRSMLESHGRIKIIAADETVKKSNWQKPFEWNVTFTVKQNNDHSNNVRGIPQGYISASEARLLAEFEALKTQMKHDKEMMLIRAQIDGKEDPFLKYMPIIPFIFDVDEAKMDKMMKFAKIGQMMGTKPGIAGINTPEVKTETKISKEMSNEEAQKAAENLNVKIQSVATKIGVENFAKVIEKIDSDPELQKTIVKLFNDPPLLEKLKILAS